MTKSFLVLRHLQRHGSITSWEAIQEYGATRLSAIIFNLRHSGWDIPDVWEEHTDRYGETVRFKRYILKRKKK